MGTQSPWTAEPDPLRWGDAPDPAGLTRHIQAAHLPPFDLRPSTTALSGDYLFGSRLAGHDSLRAQGPARVLMHASTAAPDARPSLSGTRDPEPKALSTLKGTTSQFASCADQVWSGPERPHAQGPQHGTWDPAPHCTPRYLSSLY